MNFEESAGGSSCRGQENGDASNGSERPLKKARFAWQVKGKYHLKNDTNDPAKKSITESTASEIAESSGSGRNSSNNNISTECELKTIGDYLLNQDFNSLDTVIADPNKSIPKTSTINELQYPRSIGSQCNIASHNVFVTNDNSNQLGSVPMSMVASENYTEDQCIARWQARQVAKGTLDNTINRILDYIKQNPLEDNNSTFQAFDVADFINNLPGINSIENEGILMAISAHGLQNTSSSSSFNSSSMSLDFDELCEPTVNDIMSPTLGISCLPPYHSDDESHEQTQHVFDYTVNNIDWLNSDDLKIADDEPIPSPTYHDSSSLSFQYLSETLHNADVAAAANGVATGNDHHRDFLDAAVLFAIQSRGLTTLGTDYG